MKYQLILDTSSKYLVVAVANEEKVLKYIIDNFELSSEYCAFLYEKSAKNGFLNLQQILSQKKKNSGFDEINFLYEEILGGSLWT